MSSSPRVICLGEVLIDFVSTEKGVSLAHASSFQRAAGGAPANVAVALARLGVPSGFVGKVGEEPFGEFLIETLQAEGVDSSHLTRTARDKTALAFVSLTQECVPDFLFYAGAHLMLEPSDIDRKYLKQAQAFHYGSLSLIEEPARSTTLRAAAFAQAEGMLVSYDPNYRPRLWPSPEAAREVIRQGMAYAQVVKLSRQELELVSGQSDLDRGAKLLLDEFPSVRLLTVTLGADGCYYQSRGLLIGRVPGFPMQVVDTTGAGDGFTAGLLAGLLEETAKRRLDDLGLAEIGRVLRFANAVGGLSTTRAGAIPSFPTRQQVEALLAAPEPAGTAES